MGRLVPLPLLVSSLWTPEQPLGADLWRCLSQEHMSLHQAIQDIISHESPLGDGQLPTFGARFRCLSRLVGTLLVVVVLAV